MNLNNLNFCNYHKHSVWTNPIIPDSVESIENYAQRAVDLGQKILSCVEHGWAGNYINTYEVCQKHNLKFLFGVEAYWVYDRLAYYNESGDIVENPDDGKKDKTNNHIVILAKNENGRRAINKILSQSAKDGFYYRTRIDLNQILSLPKDDVWITSACIAFNGYGFDKSYDIIKTLHNYFENNFYLEVQYHNTPSQIAWNSLLKNWSKELNINLIMGCDSHYIYEEDAWKRTDYIKSKGIKYPDEEGWYMDYPSTKVAFKRFQDQGVFNNDEIYNIINNTNEFENVEEYNCPIFNTDIKMPTLYPELTEQEKNLKLAKLVHEKWSEEKKKIPKDKWPIYEKEIKRELQTIFDVNHSDYFLLYYEGIKRGIELGGVATPTGRGCFTNDELIKTNNGIKTLGNVVVGDKVISSDGKFHSVVNTMSYDIDEPMVKISYVTSSKKHPAICTMDHKILIHRNENNLWIEAKDIKIGDYVCCPFVNFEDKSSGYHNKQSYKIAELQHPYNYYKKVEQFYHDDKFCYIPIKNIEFIDNYKGKVYDIEVEDQHNYLLGNMIVHNSAVGCYCNKLLGLTKVDRIDSPVPLFFERFMSKSRMLEAKSMADIDENINNRDIFIQAFTELFGIEHCVPMVAFGTMKVKAAWQMYAKAVNLPFELANEISHRIADYEEYAKYHTSEDDIDIKTVYDFIGEEYRETFDKSKEYLGIISDWKIAPSAVLVYNGNIEEEIGLVRCKENICCIVDKFWGDNYKFLKLDILKVSSIELIYKVFNRLGIENKDVPDTNNLLDLVSRDNKTWDIYKNGYTMGINQVEQPGAVKKVMAYKPHNISELSAFIAAIRPGFKSMYNIFESRQDFKYDIKTLDNLIQTKDMPYSFILYQENIMQMLSFAGIPLDQTYEIVKAISKKKKEKILKHKDQFVKGFTERLITEEGYSEEEANDTTEKVWRIIEDSSRYSFNSAHSYSMAFDSLYGAYLKSHYPLEFYEVFLNLLMERDEKDRAELTKSEAKKAFNIDIEPLRFRQDNRNFSVINGKNALTDSLKTIKGFGVNVAEELYNLRNNHYNNFIELLDDLSNTTINKSQIDNLILLKYFNEFGKNKKLQSFYMYYQKFRDVKVIKKTDVEKYGIPEELINKYSGKITEKQYRDIDNIGLLSEIFNMFENEDYEVKIQAAKEKFQFGFVKSKLLDVPIDWFYVNELKIYSGNKSKPYVQLYNLHTGVMINAKFKSDAYAEQPFKEGNIIRAVEFKKQNKIKKVDGEWIKTDIKETIIDKFDLLA